LIRIHPSQIVENCSVSVRAGGQRYEVFHGTVISISLSCSPRNGDGKPGIDGSWCEPTTILLGAFIGLIGVEAIAGVRCVARGWVSLL
jgi:hypothetical protein